MELTAIILAAGQGTRMRSATAKVLHPLCGRPMIDFVVRAALEAGAEDAVVVVGHQREALAAHLATAFGKRVRTAVQDEQRGTGHAVMCALPSIAAHAALVLYGDTPLVRPDDLRALAEARAEGDRALAMLTCRVPDPTGYGRVLRDGGKIAGVREQRDCTAAERAIDEVNAGMYAARVDFLRDAVGRLRADNDQREKYLTDAVAMAAELGEVASRQAPAETLAGVNDRAQLSAAEEAMYARIADCWRRAGVTIRASARVGADVHVEGDAVIEHGAVLRGKTSVGTGAVIDVGCVLTDVTVAAGAKLLPYTVAAASTVGQGARIGPFSHLREHSEVGAEAHVGNFVETKKTRLARGAKANHLAYLGDGDIGEAANVGAGTIFCNYDGVNKHKTVIGARAFIGSDSQLVAPVTVGDGAYVATGTTVTKDVPPDALAIARPPQLNKEGYAARLRARLAAKKKAE